MARRGRGGARRTNAGQLTSETTGLSERAAAILDAHIEAAAAAMARFQIERYSRQRAQPHHGHGSGGGSEQARDRLARMIAPGGSHVEYSPPRPAAAVGQSAAREPPPSTPPPTAREVRARESRRQAFLSQGVATGGSVLKAPRPAGLGRAASYLMSPVDEGGGDETQAQLLEQQEELEMSGVRRRLAPNSSGGATGGSSDDGYGSSPVGSPASPRGYSPCSPPERLVGPPRRSRRHCLRAPVTLRDLELDLADHQLLLFG